MMDSIPIVCITGQVPTHLIGSDAFQECDTVGITRHCTKHNYLVKSIEDLPRILHEAFYVASNGRPGPSSSICRRTSSSRPGLYARPTNNQHKTYRPTVKGDMEKISAAIELMAQCQAPGVLHGRRRHQFRPACIGACCANSCASRDFPVTSTLMGLGAYPASDPQFLGMLGMHGTYESNLAMHECDVMINIGARFDDRITGRLDAFSPYSKRIHVDIDPSSINKNVKVDIPIVGDCAHVLEDMVRLWRQTAAAGRQGRAEGLVEEDRGLARAQLPRLSPLGRNHQAAIRGSAPLRADQGIATPTSRPRSASTRCGRRSISSSRSRTAG